MGITLVMHGFATLRFTDAFKRRFGRPPTLASSISNPILASWCITTVHLLEVMMWARFSSGTIASRVSARPGILP